MLSDKQQQLLTAYVDGELGPRQRKLVERLVRKSPDARNMLRALQADSRELRALPRPPLPVDLSASVLQALAEPRILPLRRAAPATRRVLPWWTGVSAVASVLALFGLASFLYIEWATKLPIGSSQARQELPATTHTDTTDSYPQNPPETVAQVPEDSNHDQDPFAFVGPVKDEDDGTPVVDPRLPEPKGMNPGTAIGSPSFKEGRINVVDAVIPSLLKLRELAQEAQQTELKSSLKKYNTLYIELLGRDSAKSYDRVAAGFQASGIVLVKDAQVLVRRKQANLPTSYAFYVEDISADELTKLLQHVAAEDVAAEKRVKGDAQFNLPHANLILTRLTDDHRKTLQGLVGAELKPMPQPAKGTGPLGVDIHKDVIEGTGDQVTKGMSKPPARQALALVYQPPLARGGSVEVKQFLEHRKPARENTFQVVIVLRPLGR